MEIISLRRDFFSLAPTPVRSYIRVRRNVVRAIGFHVWELNFQSSRIPAVEKSNSVFTLYRFLLYGVGIAGRALLPGEWRLSTILFNGLNTSFHSKSELFRKNFRN